MAPTVAQLLARTLGRDEAWQQKQIAEYTQLANGYRLL
jgi:glycerol-3-phosphate dehydrogenase